jgi:hypothetical protein
MANVPPSRTRKDTLSLEIDKLLKQLPGGDPMLRGDPEPAPAPHPRPTGSAMGGAGATRPLAPVPSIRAQRLGAWLRALLAVGFGAAVSQWPYARDCGSTLYIYMGVIAVVQITGAWAAIWSWRVRVAAAHLLALVVIFWGIVLAAEQILPRIGYAARSAAWSCVR